MCPRSVLLTLLYPSFSNLSNVVEGTEAPYRSLHSIIEKSALKLLTSLIKNFPTPLSYGESPLEAMS